MSGSRSAGVSRAVCLLATALLLQACGGSAVEEAEPLSAQPGPVVGATTARLDSEDIYTRLLSVPGLTVVEEMVSPFPGTRFF